MNCPKCGSKTRKAYSVSTPENERYRRCVCKNGACGHVFYTAQRIIVEQERIVDASECKALFCNYRRNYYAQQTKKRMAKEVRNEIENFSIGKCHFKDGTIESITYLEHYSESVITFHTDSGRYMYRNYGLEPDIERTLDTKRGLIQMVAQAHTFEKIDWDPFRGPIHTIANIERVEIKKSIIDFYNEHKEK